MKIKFLLFVSIVLFISCDVTEPDTPPPSVFIQSPITNYSICEIVTIVVGTNDNEGVETVEFYVDDTLKYIDLESPYEYDWNTTIYENGSEHSVRVISYDISGNSSSTEPIFYTIDKTNCLGCNAEIEVELWGECYNIEETTIISLTTDSLSGVIPSEIGQLFNLTVLRLWDNQLTGEIPLEIGNLTNLTILSLYNNHLGCYELDSLQNCITHCSETEECRSEIPSEVGNLTNLITLSLNTNQFTGEIPPEIGNLTNLTELSLSSNKLTGEIPSEIGNLNNLVHFYLSSNQFTGEIAPEIWEMTNLSSLVLSSNQFTGEIPLEIGNLTNLTWLSLSFNPLTGEIPPEIWNLTNLMSLDLHNNQLTGEIPPEIWNLTNLMSLDLHNNQLTGEIPPEIGNLENLDILKLHTNQFISVPDSICNLDLNWSSSNDFTIYNNQLCPLYPECLTEYIGEQDTTNCGD